MAKNIIDVSVSNNFSLKIWITKTIKHFSIDKLKFKGHKRYKF